MDDMRFTHIVVAYITAGLTDGNVSFCACQTTCAFALLRWDTCLFLTDKDSELPALKERMKEIGVILHKLLVNSDSKVSL